MSSSNPSIYKIVHLSSLTELGNSYTICGRARKIIQLNPYEQSRLCLRCFNKFQQDPLHYYASRDSWLKDNPITPRNVGPSGKLELQIVSRVEIDAVFI